MEAKHVAKFLYSAIPAELAKAEIEQAAAVAHSLVLAFQAGFYLHNLVEFTPGMRERMEQLLVPSMTLIPVMHPTLLQCHGRELLADLLREDTRQVRGTATYAEILNTLTRSLLAVMRAAVSAEVPPAYTLLMPQIEFVFGQAHKHFALPVPPLVADLRSIQVESEELFDTEQLHSLVRTYRLLMLDPHRSSLADELHRDVRQLSLGQKPAGDAVMRTPCTVSLEPSLN